MAHLVIKNNAQKKTVTVATAKGKAVSGAPHIARGKIGNHKMNKNY